VLFSFLHAVFITIPTDQVGQFGQAHFRPTASPEFSAARISAQRLAARFLRCVPDEWDFQQCHKSRRKARAKPAFIPIKAAIAKRLTDGETASLSS
jgi:hypothetical protein